MQERDARLFGDRRELSRSDLGGKALDAIVRCVDLQNYAGLCIKRRKIILWVRAIGRADLDEPCPARAMISGMRKAPPISMSSPRDTTASRPLESVFRHRSTAAALLLTTVASWAPVNEHNKDLMWSSRSPRLPVSKSNSSTTAFRIAATAVRPPPQRASRGRDWCAAPCR